MISNVGNLLRTSFLVTLLGGLLLTASSPARADSISPERALLNRVDDAPGTAPAPKSFASVRADQEKPAIDGEEALLNDRPLSDTPPRPPDAADAAPSGAPIIDGADALLNHAAPGTP
jgi:hypothetical protein